VSRAGVAEAVDAAVTTSPVTNSGVPCRSAVVRVFGGAAGVAYSPDQAETARRVAVGLGPITQRSLLDALMSLPVGLPVAHCDLSRRERKLLQCAPFGALKYDAGHVIRQVVAPLMPRLAVVTARTWSNGLARAGRFAPFCARAMVLSAPPADLDEARAQASLYGIGLWVFVADELHILVNAEPYVRRRHTAAQWWFAEHIYRQVMERALSGS